MIEEPEAIERRLQERFRRFEGRSLAKELIAERREEARRESDEWPQRSTLPDNEKGKSNPNPLIRRR